MDLDVDLDFDLDLDLDLDLVLDQEPAVFASLSTHLRKHPNHGLQELVGVRGTVRPEQAERSAGIHDGPALHRGTSRDGVEPPLIGAACLSRPLRDVQGNRDRSPSELIREPEVLPWHRSRDRGSHRDEANRELVHLEVPVVHAFAAVQVLDQVEVEDQGEDEVEVHDHVQGQVQVQEVSGCTDG